MAHNKEVANNMNSNHNQVTFTHQKARRLLERLKSPFLHIASQLPSTTHTPHFHQHVSPDVRQLAAKVETLSGSRFILTRDQSIDVKNLNKFALLKVYDIACGHSSWLSLAQMEADSSRLDRWCCYCGEPRSFRHIGDDSVHRFVELRSGGRTFFSRRNETDGRDLTDIFLFNCLVCKGGHYDAPFTWFLRDSKPGSSETCGCPCCEAKLMGYPYI